MLDGTTLIVLLSIGGIINLVILIVVLGWLRMIKDNTRETADHARETAENTKSTAEYTLFIYQKILVLLENLSDQAIADCDKAIKINPGDAEAYINRGTAVSPPSYNIGDTGPSGVGKVFYITDGGLHGLEVAPAGWNGDYKDPISLWSGAAQLCRDYAGGGKNDWFLPSKEELNQLYLNQDVVGGFAGDPYWSSSEYSVTYAWYQLFLNGGQGGGYKNSNNRVRAVRAF